MWQARLGALLQKPWMRVLLYLGIAYSIWCSLLYFAQDMMLFPCALVSQEPIQPPEGTTRVWIEGKGGEQVEGWYLSPLVRDSETFPAVVFFHGNGELIDYWSDDLSRFRKWGMALFLPEYRGYGRSGGSPGQAEIQADMLKFHDWLVQQPGVDPNRIVYFGRSLGGGVACQLARERPPAAMILLSTFKSVKSMAAGYLVPSFLIKHPFENEPVIRSWNRPLLIMHGKRDQLVPVEHGRRLREIAPASIYREIDCGHNDLPLDEAFWKEIQDFLRVASILREPESLVDPRRIDQ